MPKVFKSNNFIISDEVFTITEDEFQPDAKKGKDETSFNTSLDFEQERRAHRHEMEEERKQAHQLLEEAQEQARNIIREASARAQQERDDLLAQTNEQCEQLRQQAFAQSSELGLKQGLREGIEQQIETVRSAVESLEQTISRIEGEHAGFMAEHEQNLKWLALEIAGKILGARIEQDDTQMISLVKAAVSTVKKSKWITIELSNRMTSLIQTLEDQLKLAGDDKIDVRPIEAPEGTCIIDTPDGVIDASISTQLENLRIYFREEQ